MAQLSVSDKGCLGVLRSSLALVALCPFIIPLTSYFAQMQDVPACALWGLGMVRWRAAGAAWRLTGHPLVYTL